MLYHVVAMAEGRVIGKDNKLPWHFSSDLKHFRQLTTGSTVIMGRKTFESIGKPLPNRDNFVLSRRNVIASKAATTAKNAVIASPKGAKQSDFQEQIASSQPSAAPRNDDSRVHFFSSLEDALAHVKTPDAYIIGGAEIYRQTMDKIDGIYLTQIEGRYDGDTFYPELPAHFKEKSRTKLQDNPKIEVLFYENQRPS